MGLVNHVWGERELNGRTFRDAVHGLRAAVHAAASRQPRPSATSSAPCRSGLEVRLQRRAGARTRTAAAAVRERRCAGRHEARTSRNGSRTSGVSTRPNQMIKTVAVLGAGTMGHGIAHAAMTAGYDTRPVRHLAGAGRQGPAGDHAVIKKSVDLGKMSPGRRPTPLRAACARPPCRRGGRRRPTSSSRRRPRGSTSRSRCSRKSKRQRRPQAVIASNTSALSITEMAAVARESRPDGRHALLQPGAPMKLIEVVKALETSPRRSR